MDHSAVRTEGTTLVDDFAYDSCLHPLHLYGDSNCQYAESLLIAPSS